MTGKSPSAPAAEHWVDPVDGVITSLCGERTNPLGEDTQYHNGLDIAAPLGTPVAAARSGIVTEVRTSESYGNLVRIQTDDAFSLLYAHLDEVLVHKGDVLTQGQTVATVGSTGYSTGPHLHYSVWKGAMLMDPMQFVSLDYTKNLAAEVAARGGGAP